ncbi:MAG TPA: polysaccharide biosynthesis tyrosine autokinase [Solirubrobacteraceae bacterium]|nr:polysaccharide biosynthesis tyrosine autokinase [Solirubrobacteraceae bacterium]
MTGANPILPLLWRRRVTFLAAAVATFAAAAALTFTLPRVYTSEAYLLVTPTQEAGSDFAATQLTQLLTKTYSELLQTDSVADAVDQRLGIENSGEAISVTAVPQSQLLSIEAEGDSPEQAREVAGAYAAVFTSRVGELEGANRAGQVTVAERASTPTGPTRPRPVLYLALGALLAALAGLGAALLRDRLDQRVMLDSATTEIAGLPILGRLPRGANRAEGEAALAEASRLLLANLAFANMGQRPRTVAVVSAGEGEGKSTCTLSIGRAAAELGTEVLVVEADLRRPGLVDKVKTARRAREGFATALVRPDMPVADAVVHVPGSTLDLLPSGPIPPNPAALLAGDRFGDFDVRARTVYDLVVYDTPPFSAGADAALVSSVAEGVVLVVDATKTHRTPMLQAIEQLRRSRANVLGVVVNRAPDAVDAYYGGDPQGERLSPVSIAPPPRADTQHQTAGHGWAPVFRR